MLESDEESTALWHHCDADDLEATTQTINNIFQSFRNSEVPALALTLMGEHDFVRESGKCGTVLLLVTDNELIIPHLNKLLCRSGILVKRVSCHSFLNFEMSEHELQSLERDVWWRKADKLLIAVASQHASDCDTLNSRKDWLSFVEYLHARSPILRSYSSRGDVRYGLTFLNWIDFTLRPDTCVSSEKSERFGLDLSELFASIVMTAARIFGLASQVP